MKSFAHETIIISKTAWKFLWNFERQKGGCKPLTKEQFDRLWQRVQDFRNKGANPATHPIKKNEIRIDKDSFNMKWDETKRILIDNGFKYREDNFVAKGMYM
jgi:hypothetical protein